MNLSKYKFEDVSAGTISIVGTDRELLAEAISRGFDSRRNPFNQMFSDLFFNGGSVNFRADVDS
jgi:hypothetical protein